MTIASVVSWPGDRAVLIRELERLLPTGFRVAYAMLGSRPEAEDALQDAVLKAWRALHRVRPDAELRPWFMTIVANECRQRRRNRWWSVIKASALPSKSDMAAEPSADTTDLRSALRRLPIDMRLILVLRYYLDLPFAEIGRTLKCSPQAAKSRTHRALQRLRVEVPEELGP